MWEGSAGGMRWNPKQCPNSLLCRSHTLPRWAEASQREPLLNLHSWKGGSMAALRASLYAAVCLSAGIITAAGKCDHNLSLQCPAFSACVNVPWGTFPRILCVLTRRIWDCTLGRETEHKSEKKWLWNMSLKRRKAKGWVSSVFRDPEEKLCEIIRVWCHTELWGTLRSRRFSRCWWNIQTFETNSNNTASQEQDSCRNILTVQVWVVLSSVTRLTLLNNKRSVLLVRKTERKKKRTWSLSWWSCKDGWEGLQQPECLADESGHVYDICASLMLLLWRNCQ